MLSQGSIELATCAKHYWRTFADDVTKEYMILGHIYYFPLTAVELLFAYCIRYHNESHIYSWLGNCCCLPDKMYFSLKKNHAKLIITVNFSYNILSFAKESILSSMS